jgi:intein-encoded DNA endonuclease-like protein
MSPVRKDGGGGEEMTTEQNFGPERLSLLACSPVPGAGTSLGGERRAREISNGNEETVKTESSQQHGELVPVEKDEVVVVVASENKKKFTPRELRIKVHRRVIELRQQGRSYNEIRAAIKEEFGIVLSKSQISYWTRGIHDPHNGRRIPSLELLQLSEDLAYVIGVLCGDGSVWEKSRVRKGYRRVVIYLEAKDREFVEEFAIRIGRVLNRPPPKVRVKSTGYYYVEVESRTLYELCKKPIDIEKIRRFVEHCERCMAMFLRGFFDSEGGVSKHGQISLTNSNYDLLLYVQELLKRFGIESRGPRVVLKKGRTFYNPLRGKVYKYNKDVYVLYVKANCTANFYYYVGFTILRKRARLEDYLRRMRIPIPTPFIPFLHAYLLMRLWAPCSAVMHASKGEY